MCYDAIDSTFRQFYDPGSWLGSVEVSFPPAAPEQLLLRRIDEIDDEDSFGRLSRSLWILELRKIRLSRLVFRQIVPRIVVQRCYCLVFHQNDVVSDQEISFTIGEKPIPLPIHRRQNVLADLAPPIGSVRDRFGGFLALIRQEPERSTPREVAPPSLSIPGFHLVGTPPDQ